ncbi:MAG: M20/M25/M40 family metallo-hydrolase [Solobacterium sp.]|nr:M20/M25/M40 family metallo-hydrolase [Solobacterium sp.]MBQ1446022.1 M20/M25/M40 family metallo-hydrolase [Solobacterium sp.]MBR2726960.1 M20/M25/M40 family metallo-hydrolase [Solobacterium sp.]
MNKKEPFISAHTEEAVRLLETLGRIPAPSHQEDKRAAFIKDWFAQAGVKNVSIDGAKNVICTFGLDRYPDIAVIQAHTDIVFPDTEELPMVRDGNILRAPGIGDDTANLVNLMIGTKYFLAHESGLKTAVIIAANSCEEGLGNLDGTKEIFRVYGDRIKEFISLDGSTGWLVNSPVGSHRYAIDVKTKGGHSYGDFGNDSAIGIMAEIIHDFYRQSLPEQAYTTYNAGVIEGGSTVNSIAQECTLLYEYRSENDECLAYMKKQMNGILERHRKEGIQIECRTLGIRPGLGDLDPDAQARLEEDVKAAMGTPMKMSAGSTDANIPLSMGIPAVTVGTIVGEGAHTREEWVDLASIPQGLGMVLNLLDRYFDSGL